MTRSSLAVWALVFLALAGPARAQSRIEYGYPPPQLEPTPPSGIGALVVGAAGFATAGSNLVTIPVCYANFYPYDARPCTIASLVIVGVALSVAVPSLVVGLHRRARYKAWRARQRTRGELSPWGASRAAGLHYALHF
jgi:hypothetical protein